MHTSTDHVLVMSNITTINQRQYLGARDLAASPEREVPSS